MTPRGSISSVMSTGLQSFIYNSDFDDEDEKDDEDVSKRYRIILFI